MKKILCYLFLLSALGCGSPEAQKEPPEIKRITPLEAIKVLDEMPNMQVVDVRTPGEMAKGQIKNAININYYSPSAGEEVKKLDKDRPVLVYCARGGRSAKVADALHSQGFEVYDLIGGIYAWKAAAKDAPQ